MSNYNVIVIGGGINSLVTANLLGQAGRKVILLEAREQVGGMAATLEFTPGFKCNLLYDHINWIDPRILKKLDLSSNGLELITPKPLRIALDEKSNHICFYKDAAQTAASISKHSKKDSDTWQVFPQFISSLSEFLERLYKITPPDFPKVGITELFSLRSMLTPLRRYGSRGLTDLMRVIPMMMPELMDEWFESDLLRGAIAGLGVKHLTQGPYSAGTGLNLLHQHLHSKGIFAHTQLVKGGTANLTTALEKAALKNGIEIRTSLRVKSIEVNNSICTGIRLEDNQILSADKIVSGPDPNNTFINLIGMEKLSPNFSKQIQNLKFKGSTARIHYTLKGLPEIPGVPPENMNTIFAVSPSIEYVERAYDDAKYGRISDEPYIEFTIPSINNSNFSPYGTHVLSTTVQYAPYHLRGSQWSDELKNQILQNTNRVLEKYIPGFAELVEDSKVISPQDMEYEFGLTGGNLNHGELTLDQFFFMRPVIRSAQYRTPIENLYLCGPGTHPGGGLHGTSGINAAGEILKD